MPARAAASLCLLAALALPLRADDALVSERLDAISKEYDKTRGELLKDLGRLIDLRETMPTAKDPESAAREGSQVIQEARQKLQALDDSRREFQGLIGILRAKSARRVLRRGKRGLTEGGAEATGELLARTIRHEEQLGRISDSFGALEQGVEDQAGKFADTLAATRQRRERGRSSDFLLGAALVLLALLAAFALRRRLSPAPATAVPTSPILPVPDIPERDAAAQTTGQCPQPMPGMPAVLQGNYEVLRMIGRGGMGEVYEALDRDLERKVAVKRMREELLSVPKELEQFLSEARLVASLRHPNIVGIYSVVREGGQLFLVLELVRGWTLHHILAKHPRLSPAQAKYVLRCAASALDYAHSMNVVHRDLKPANVMVSRDNQVKVMDFGIAYQAQRTAAMMTNAKAWGTPPYMSPEQELGRVSRDVDVYSLAVCFYEMLTGALPFPGPDYLAQKKDGFFTLPSRLAGGLPRALDEVFRRALSPELEKRYRTAGELAAAADRA